MNNKILSIFLGLIVILLGASIFFVCQPDNDRELLKSFEGKYQAVFLSNDQVYFGKVSQIKNDFVTLNDIYYLKINRNLQSPIENEEDLESSPGLILIKLGKELHGPEDEMKINQDHILFIENLKDDGKVVQVIKNQKQ